MSRAFVKEQDDQEGLEELPEIPISSSPNFVTPRGLILIDEEIEAARKLLAESPEIKAGEELFKSSLRELKSNLN